MLGERLSPPANLKATAKKAGLIGVASSSLFLSSTHIHADTSPAQPHTAFHNSEPEKPVNPLTHEVKNTQIATVTGTESLKSASVNQTPLPTEIPSVVLTPTAEFTISATQPVPTETATPEPIQTMEDTATEKDARSDFAFILEGDEIQNKEMYSRLVYEEIKNSDALKTHIEQIKGEGANVPEFDPETQIAFVAALTDENYKPAFTLEGLKEVDGKTIIDLSYASQTVDDEGEYNAGERNSYIIGIIDRPADGSTVSLQTSFVDATGPFLITTLGKVTIENGFAVTVPGLASGTLDQCFGTSMTEIRELQKQFPEAHSVEFEEHFDNNGNSVGWSWHFVTEDGERFAWNDFAKDPSCPDSRPEECFGTSMTEILEMQKQFPTAHSVEFQEQLDNNGKHAGWTWYFVDKDGEKFAWNDFAKDPSCPDSRPLN